jgi:hypothetical protein
MRGASCCDLLVNEPGSLQGVAAADSITDLRQRAAQLIAVPAPPAPTPAIQLSALPRASSWATAPPAGPEPLYLRHASLLL